VRQTGGVLLELIDSALTEIQLAIPFVDDSAVEYLLSALLGAGRRGADVIVVTSTGNGHKFLAVSREWADKASGVLRITEVATHLSPLGSHAKALVVDRTRGYVGSANLTSAGLARNIEIGVELAGPDVADLAQILSALERLGASVKAVHAGKRQLRKGD
jgi:phosphatidylserine/phosphatidylglycerophosphate/cardiolipin synthase-like enzyme